METYALIINLEHFVEYFQKKSLQASIIFSIFLRICKVFVLTLSQTAINLEKFQNYFLFSFITFSWSSFTEINIQFVSQQKEKFKNRGIFNKQLFLNQHPRQSTVEILQNLDLSGSADKIDPKQKPKVIYIRFLFCIEGLGLVCSSYEGNWVMNV